jgi:hypothetical protein
MSGIMRVKSGLILKRLKRRAHGVDGEDVLEVLLGLARLACGNALDEVDEVLARIFHA